jgi:hypothetical protein
MNAENSVKDLTFKVHHTMLPVADLDRSRDYTAHQKLR